MKNLIPKSLTNLKVKAILNHNKEVITIIFRYKALAHNGQVIEGVFEAGSESEVISMIKGNNHLPISV